MNLAAYRWRELAERRRSHFVELYVSGRWRHYYSDRTFFAALREAAEAASRWAELAPLPEDQPADDAYEDDTYPDAVYPDAVYRDGSCAGAPDAEAPLQKTAA